MTRIKTIALTLLIFTLTVTACSNAPVSTPELNIAPTSTIAPPQTQKPIFTATILLTPTQAPNRLPLTEADVPRVTVENAKAAFDNGKAIIVDVRSKLEYDTGHIAGALYVPIADMQNNSAESVLPKDKWIITYCT